MATEAKADDIQEIIVEEFQDNVLFIQNALTMDEQMSLWQDLVDRDKTEFYAKFANNPRAKLNAQFKKNNNIEEKKQENKDGAPSKKHAFPIKFDKNSVFEFFKSSDNSIYNQLVQKANDIINKKFKDYAILKQYKDKGIALTAIVYKSPNGNLGNHIDKATSLVYLFSLGCTANFYIHGPKMDKERVIKFKSGDMLLFDASSEAKVMHGVQSIDDTSTCPKDLGDKYEKLKTNRVGVQCRIHFKEL